MQTRRLIALKNSLKKGRGFFDHAGRPGSVGGSLPRGSLAVVLPEPYPAPHTVKAAARRLAEAGFRTWLVGGSVRDWAAGKTPHDFDMATDATPEQTKSVFGRHVKPDVGGEEHGTVRVQEGGDIFEITTLRLDVATDGRRAAVAFTDDILKDLQRRDLSFNALAIEYDPGKDGFAVMYGPGDRGSPREALEDLKNKTVRFVGNGLDRIKEDRLRALRAVRFAAKMDGRLSDEAINDIKEAVSQGLIKMQPDVAPDGASLSGERVRDELLKTLALPAGVKGVRLWKKLGLLDEFFGDFAGAENQSQNKYHGDVTVQEHIFRTMERAKIPSGDLSVFRGMAEHLDVPIESAALAALRFTMMLHDVAKTQVAKPREDRPGEYSFIGHEDVGAEIANRYARRLKMDTDLISLATTGVAEHMAVPDPSELGDSAIRRWARKLREKNPGLVASGMDPVEWLLAIRKADWGAKPVNDDVDPETDVIGEVKIRQALLAAPPVQNNKTPIPGEKVMEWTGLKQGPAIGKIMRQVKEYLDEHPDADESKIKDVVIQAARGLEKSLAFRMREAIHGGLHT